MQIQGPLRVGIVNRSDDTGRGLHPDFCPRFQAPARDVPVANMAVPGSH